jgi:hypothetical protein
MLKLKYVIRLGKINKIPKFQNRLSIAATSSKNWSFNSLGHPIGYKRELLKINHVNKLNLRVLIFDVEIEICY